jgi:hypothetical protein
MLQDQHKVNLKDIFKQAWEEEEFVEIERGGLNLALPIIMQCKIVSWNVSSLFCSRFWSI